MSTTRKFAFCALVLGICGFLFGDKSMQHAWLATAVILGAIDRVSQ